MFGKRTYEISSNHQNHTKIIRITARKDMENSNKEERNMFKLRFYRGNMEYAKGKNEKILSLLEEIKRKHKIDYEIFDVYFESHEKEIYEKHFMPRARVLKQRIGESLRETLRSRRGHYYIAGRIAVLENEQIEWYTCYKSCERFKDLDEDYEIGFLKALLNQGIDLLKEICPDISISKSTHDFLIDEFVKLNPIGGKIQREVRVGSRFFTNEVGIFDFRKSIDLLVESGETKWIIEVKPKLNWEAFGQVIAYEHLFKKENPSSYTQKGIVCNEIDPEILTICREFDIKVFMWQNGKFKKI